MGKTSLFPLPLEGGGRRAFGLVRVSDATTSPARANPLGADRWGCPSPQHLVQAPAVLVFSHATPTWVLCCLQVIVGLAGSQEVSCAIALASGRVSRSEPDAFVYELQAVGLFDINAGREHARRGHGLVERLQRASVLGDYDLCCERPVSLRFSGRGERRLGKMPFFPRSGMKTSENKAKLNRPETKYLSASAAILQIHEKLRTSRFQITKQMLHP